MRMITRIGGGLAVLVGSLALMSGSALAATTFNEQITGSQTSAGAPNCQFPPSTGCTIGSAGTISGTPIASGSFTSSLTISYTSATTGHPGYAFCAPANGTSTLSDGTGTITEDQSGQVCASSYGSGGSYTFIAKFTVTSGTGAYSGVTGTGTVYTYQPTQSSSFTGWQVGPYPRVISADTPIAYWRLGDAWDQSTLSDSSGNGWNGQYKNGATGTAGSPQPSYGVSGDGDTAAMFTGNGTYAYVNGLQAPQSAYTIETWIMPTNLGAQMIFSQGGAGAVWINGSGQLAFRQVDNFGDSEIDYTLPAGFDLTKFHQVVATWDGSTANLYLDATLVGSKSVADPVSGAGTIYLGYGAFAPWFSGYMDEAAYYNEALTDSQVLAHYYADPPLNLPASAVHTSGSGTGSSSAGTGSNQPGVQPSPAKHKKHKKRKKHKKHKHHKKH